MEEFAFNVVTFFVKLQLPTAYGVNGLLGVPARRLAETMVRNKGLESKPWKRIMQGLATTYLPRRNNAAAMIGEPTVVLVRHSSF